ncbi:uncharacterized protein LOC118203490 [Stegodyphus dumicola]|uniref:uncharacterized protein LOC118203490 n=1 Tax=Stegodyphus dumicola TaxID=202533 RepID=UPI0015AB4FEE|nr:uncharacterized protein LOC118203490 [Stegodyphus dumicola]
MNVIGAVILLALLCVPMLAEVWKILPSPPRDRRVCRPTKPCAWVIYEPDTKRYYGYLRTKCDCRRNQRCSLNREIPDLFRYEYLCTLRNVTSRRNRTRTSDSENTTETELLVQTEILWNLTSSPIMDTWNETTPVTNSTFGITFIA